LRSLTTGAERDHTVKVIVGGLQPGRTYYYRFVSGGRESPTGQTRTLPTGHVEQLVFAIASCSNFPFGFFNAYEVIAEDDGIDFVVHLGDYIYESGYGEHRVRLFDKREAVTLTDFRHRYAQYKLDPDLQAAHEACPWLVTWDDHEVSNDYATLVSSHEGCGGPAVRDAFVSQRAAAYQAWYENMPVRESRLRAGAGIQLYGDLDWGRLARFYVLDTRQYRSPLACALPATFATCDTEAGRALLRAGAGGGRQIGINDPACKPELEDPSRTMLGSEQERWLDGALSSSRARWNLFAQGTPFAGILEGPPEAPTTFSDGWPGYPAARQRLLDALARHRVANPVILSGDPHAFFVNEVRNARGASVAVEMITTSIANNNKDKSKTLPTNPHIRFHDGTHSGYILCEATPGRMRADMVAIEDMRDPRTPRSVLASYEIVAGSSQPRRLEP